MVVPAHTLLSYSGVFGSSAAPLEIWNWTVKFLPQVIDVGPTGYAQQAHAAYVAGIAPIMAEKVVLTRTRVVSVAPGGKYAKDGQGGFLLADDFTEALGGRGNSGTQYPLQTALVVSLTTPRAGATGRGRSFLPAPPYGLQSFLYSASDTQTFLDGFGTFLTAAEAILGKAQVCSEKGYTSEVNGLRVGRAPDTMRSRRGSLDEGYLTAAR